MLLSVNSVDLPSLGHLPGPGIAPTIADIHSLGVAKMAGIKQPLIRARSATDSVSWSPYIVSTPRPLKPSPFALNPIHLTLVQLPSRPGIGVPLMLSIVLVFRIPLPA